MTNKLYAFDFDGVICDSAVETGLAGWRVALHQWSDMPEQMPAEIAEQFRQVRPVMETGYEAILMVRLLFEGLAAETLLEEFQPRIEALMIRDELFVDELKQAFGETRDNWIANAMDDWINMNPLFTGLADKLNSIASDQLVIITTKQERFVDHILQANNIQLPAAQIYGLDRKLKKPEILNHLSQQQSADRILFIEDRLPTLHNVIEDDRLEHVELLFADWGYNTAADKKNAQNEARIQLLSLSDLTAL